MSDRPDPVHNADDSALGRSPQDGRQSTAATIRVESSSASTVTVANRIGILPGICVAFPTVLGRRHDGQPDPPWPDHATEGASSRRAPAGNLTFQDARLPHSQPHTGLPRPRWPM